MINPAHSNRNSYSPYRHQKHPSNKDVNFADLYQASATARASGTQAQRAAVATKEDTTDFAPRMAWYDDLEHVSFEGVVSLAVGEVTAEPTFPASIHDLSQNEIEGARHNAKATVARLDFEGKTMAEKYKEIRSVYENYLGKDFEEPISLFLSDADQMHRVYNSFYDSLKDNGIGLENTDLRKEAYGYGDMSDDEIRTAMREKYPKNMTFRECLLMSRELDGLNLQDSPGNQTYSSAFRTRIMFALGGWTPTTQKVYNAMMDMPADYEAMKASYADHVKNDYRNSPINDMNGVIARLTSITGGDASAYSGIYDMLTEMEQNGDLYFDHGLLRPHDFGE
jgi:hypothetical protein